MATLLEDLSQCIEYSTDQFLDSLPLNLKEIYASENINLGRGLEILTRGFMYSVNDLSVVCNKPGARFGNDEKQVEYGSDGHNFRIFGLAPRRLSELTEVDGFGVYEGKPVIFEASTQHMSITGKNIGVASRFLESQFKSYSSCVFVKPGSPSIELKETPSPYVTEVYHVRLHYDFDELCGLLAIHKNK